MSKFKTHVTEFLKQQQIEFDLLLQSRPAVSIDDAAQLRGIRPSQMIKSILLRDMDDQYALACVPGNQSVDPKKVRHFLGWKRMTCVNGSDVERITGYQIGTVNPLLLRRNMPIIFDPNTRNEPIVTISSGDRMAGIALHIDDLTTLCQPNFAEISKPKK